MCQQPRWRSPKIWWQSRWREARYAAIINRMFDDRSSRRLPCRPSADVVHACATAYAVRRLLPPDRLRRGLPCWSENTAGSARPRQELMFDGPMAVSFDSRPRAARRRPRLCFARSLSGSVMSCIPTSPTASRQAEPQGVSTPVRQCYCDFKAVKLPPLSAVVKRPLMLVPVSFTAPA